MSITGQTIMISDVQRKLKIKKMVYSTIISCLEMLLYMCRWQLSTFTMTPVIIFAKYLGIVNSWEQVALANLISAPPFFFIDKFILVYVRVLIKKAISHFKKKKNKTTRDIGFIRITAHGKNSVLVTNSYKERIIYIINPKPETFYYLFEIKFNDNANTIDNPVWDFDCDIKAKNLRKKYNNVEEFCRLPFVKTDKNGDIIGYKNNDLNITYF